MKKTVVELECSRCHRKEYVPFEVTVVTEGTVAVLPPPPAILITIGGKVVAQYDDLCDPCKQAVMGYIEQITKPLEKKSPNRKKKSALEEAVEERQEAAAAGTTIQNGAGAKKEGVHQHPPPAVVTRPR